MKICFPVDRINGFDSEIAPNFRAAPALLVVDLESKQYHGIEVSASACQATPTQIDAIVCAGGMGRGQFNGLRQRGIRVFNTEADTVLAALQDLAADNLVEVMEVECCGSGRHNHDHDHQHAHGEGGCGCGGHAHEQKNSGCGCGHQH